MEAFVLLLEIILMVVAIALAICVLCLMAAITYIALADRKEFDKEFEDYDE